MGQAGYAGRLAAADASSSVTTTMGYYVDLDADEVAGDLWAKFGNTKAEGNIPGNIAKKEAVGDVARIDVTCCNKTR